MNLVSSSFLQEERRKLAAHVWRIGFTEHVWLAGKLEKTTKKMKQ